MSWLKNHMRHYVLPGVRALARADGKTLFDHDIRPVDRIIRPSTKCAHVEAGMLYAACSSILRKSNPAREVALGLCRQVGKPGDAEFVYELDLGGRGVDNRVRELGNGYQDVEGADVLHSFIVNSIKELKRRTKKKATVVYPGRDVWCWEVLSRRLGMPSLFDARISRSIATNEKAIKKAIEPWQISDWNRTVLFDSGYAGTVPRAIGKAAGLDKAWVLMLSAVNEGEQIFKTHTKARKKALACEYLAKYQKRATVRDDAPYQELAGLEEFIKAALLTIWLWYHISPSRLPAWQEQPAKKPPSRFKIARAGSLSVGTGGLTWGTSGTSVFTPITTNSTNNWATASTATTSPWVIDQTSVTTSASTLDQMWGAGTSSGVYLDIIQQQQQQIASLKTPVVPAVDPNTFQLVDPVSKVPLEPAMDSKCLGLDPVQHDIAKGRAAQIASAYAKPGLDQARSSNIGKVIIDNSQASQSSGGPGGGSPTPTTGKGTPPVAGGIGKATTV